jgi:tetratricopeptide (TPR) repeat protein
MSEKMNELFNLTQKAQKMELINEEIALDIYIEIFENYTPKISKTYESAIRLLEKRGRFSEALAICERAIKLISEDQISGVIGKFETTRERLLKKMGPETPVVQPKKKPPLKLIIGLIFVVVVAIGICEFSKPYDDLDVNLEGKESLPGGSAAFSGSDDPEADDPDYPVTESMIQIAVTETLKNHDAIDVVFTPQTGTIGIGILVSPGTDAKRCQALAEIALKALGGAAAATYKDLEGPTGDTLGSLYDYYELVISVGTGSNESEIIAKGTKNKTSTAIYWH